MEGLEAAAGVGAVGWAAAAAAGAAGSAPRAAAPEAGLHLEAVSGARSDVLKGLRSPEVLRTLGD